MFQYDTVKMKMYISSFVVLGSGLIDRLNNPLQILIEKVSVFGRADITIGSLFTYWLMIDDELTYTNVLTDCTRHCRMLFIDILQTVNFSLSQIMICDK